ncbi:MAG: hypothetical protein ACREPP_03555, partial [Rhodanobacteraceae bacterium]
MPWMEFQATGSLAPSLALARRAIGFTDVRFGILPPRTSLRRNDDQKNYSKSRNDRNCSERDGCRSLRSALA